MSSSYRVRSLLSALVLLLGCLFAPQTLAQPCGHWQPGAPFDALPSSGVIGFALQTADNANDLWCALRGGPHDLVCHTDGSGTWITEPPPFPTIRYSASGVWNGQPVFGFSDDAGPTTRGVTIRTSGAGWSTFSATNFVNVRAFAALGPTLYAVGVGQALGVSRGEVWVNDGSGWSLLAVGQPDSEFLAAAAYNGQVYIGGRFTSVQMVPAGATVMADNLARFDGSVWSEVAFSRLDGRVTALYTHAWDPTSPRGGQLIVSGDFLTAGGVIANHIAAFTDPPIGGYWHALGSGLASGPATAFDTRNIGPASADLIVGGPFTGAGGVAGTKALARWSAGAWSSTGVQFASSFPVHLAAHRGFTIIGGRAIEWMLGVRANFVLAFDGLRVHTLGRGTDHELFDLSRSTDGQSLYAVGNFSLIENTPASHVAVRPIDAPDAPWMPVGAGTNGYTASVLAHAGNVYVGGQFTQAGTAAAANIARWDGLAWNAMPGIISTWTGVHDLLMFNGLPTAIGATFAGNPGVAQWNGASWQGLGPPWPATPFYSIPTSACIHNGQLHVAGALNLPGVGACTIARFTGSDWTPVGTFPLQAHALASFNGELYASASITDNSGDCAVYRFDGAGWVPLNGGDAPLAPIYRLAVIGGRLLAAGAEKYAGAWNGSAWRRLDLPGSSGSVVYALESCSGADDTIAFGGSFDWMNPAIPSRRLARYSFGKCAADFNCSGQVTIQDLFDFLAAYFAADPAADIYTSGTITVQDIFEFLALWFAGCS